MSEKIVSCRTCKAPIMFLRSQDKIHPVDANSTPGWYQDDTGVWKFAKFHPDHFLTCPEGEKKDGHSEARQG